MFFAEFDDDGNKELTMAETGEILDAISDDEFELEGAKMSKGSNNKDIDMDDNAPVFGNVTEGDMQL